MNTADADKYLSATWNYFTAVSPMDGLHADSDKCAHCGAEMEEVPMEGLYVCPVCGVGAERLFMSDEWSEERECPVAYKKLNHFNEILAQFQAKETGMVPESVMADVEAARQGKPVTEAEVRSILKRLGKSLLYEHATAIMWRLNGGEAPCITMEQEERLRLMFREIQVPFLKYSAGRKNMMSYKFVIYKMFGLMGLYEYQKCISLLKSRDRLLSHEALWKQICEELGWEFQALP